MSDKVIEIKWYACEKCRTIDSYEIYEDGSTSFPRGEYLGHWKYLVSGLATKAAAEKWLEAHPAPESGQP